MKESGESNAGGMSNKILELDMENIQQTGWKQIGEMKEGRFSPGVTLVSSEDYAQSCR